MKKEFIVKGIDAAPDGTYVVVSLTSPKDVDSGMAQNPFKKPMGFSNMNDMMKDLNKMFGGMQGMMGNMTTLKLSMFEYKETGISVGDKVFLELSKIETSGV